MTTYDEKLALARAERILTEEEGEATGGAYFNEDMGLWIRQDADGGGIMPFSFQMDSCRSHNFPTVPVMMLFNSLGRRADIEAYERSMKP